AADFTIKAFRWTPGGGMVEFLDSHSGSQATGVSGDGSVIVGNLSGLGFRWTSGGWVSLDETATLLVRANGVSADGSVVVGVVGQTPPGPEAFRWTSGGGIVGLGDFPGGDSDSQAYGVSADGSVVVGKGSSAFGQEPFRWTSGDGMVGLGGPAGGVAYGVSGDGSVVVGDSGGEAFIWDSTSGVRSLREVLVDLALGPVLSGWTLSRATAISDDGLTIVGNGLNPSGQLEAWIAVIPPTTLVPVFAPYDFAPVLLAGLVIGGALVLVSRVRRGGAERR
ncbi:MAG: hypothetical protein V3T24_05970, partial [Longimicrobiales bacterium]